MGVLEHLGGVLVHDGWSSHRNYKAVEHALCSAHNLRELDDILEVVAQDWVTDMVALLTDIWHRVLDLRQIRSTSLSASNLATFGILTTRSSCQATLQIRQLRQLESVDVPRGPRPITSYCAWTSTQTTCSDLLATFA